MLAQKHLHTGVPYSGTRECLRTLVSVFRHAGMECLSITIVLSACSGIGILMI